MEMSVTNGVGGGHLEMESVSGDENRGGTAAEEEYWI